MDLSFECKIDQFFHDSPSVPEDKDARGVADLEAEQVEHDLQAMRGGAFRGHYRTSVECGPRST